MTYRGIRLWGGVVLLPSLLLVNADSIWDYAPDFSKDAYPPYPNITNPDGSNLTIENWRGTKLYGWKGCTPHEANDIAQTYNDFHKIVSTDGIYKNIDWSHAAATDFWGPADGDYQIPDDTRKEIQQIFAAAQQVWYRYGGFPEPPWLSWRYLWIEVRCSDGKTGKDSSDPENACRDATPNDGKCWNGWPPEGGNDNGLEAFSDPSEKYSRITFCRKFFKLPSLDVAMDVGKSPKPEEQRNLDEWENRARVFLHEVTHLDYFVNAGEDGKGESPFVSDIEIKTAGRWQPAYGALYARTLSRWIDPDPQYSAYFTQRNADNYAFFALAKYVEKATTRYPDRPKVGNRKVAEEPRDAQSHEAPRSSKVKEGRDTDEIPETEEDLPSANKYPGCGDKVGKSISKKDMVAMISAQYGPKPTPTPEVPKPKPLPPTTVSDRYCYPSDAFGKHKDIQGYLVDNYINQFVCDDTKNKNFKAGDRKNWNTTERGVPYNFNIWWKEDCKTDTDTLNVNQPLADDKGTKCVELMKGNYKKCNNGGIGGNISVGCLTYEFKASKTPPGQTGG